LGRPERRVVLKHERRPRPRVQRREQQRGGPVRPARSRLNCQLIHQAAKRIDIHRRRVFLHRRFLIMPRLPRPPGRVFSLALRCWSGSAPLSHRECTSRAFGVFFSFWFPNGHADRRSPPSSFRIPGAKNFLFCCHVGKSALPGPWDPLRFSASLPTANSGC